MKKIGISLILLSILGTVYSQNNDGTQVISKGSLIFRSASPTVKAEGTPYVTENFQPLNIKQYEGKVYIGRYNAYNGEMEVRLTEDNIIVLNKNENLELTFISKNKTYRTYTYSDENHNSKRGFLVVLTQKSGFILLKEEKIKLHDEIKPASSYHKGSPPKFKKGDDTFYISIDGEIKVLSQKKKQFLNSFPKHSSKLKSFMKKNKLNLKNEVDLIKIIKYLSTL